MKPIITTVLFIFIALAGVAQKEDRKILKVIYKSIPVSQYNINDRGTTSQQKERSHALLSSHQTFYQLNVNLETRASYYKYDSLVFNKPKGFEQTGLSLADEVKYAFKRVGKVTNKYESVMDQKFFSKGEVGDFQWEITNEKKKINGLNCIKAVAKDKKLMLTAWFTTDIPVSSGPSVYFGLPGLVVWVEDFFRTTQLESVEYLNDVQAFDTEMAKLEAEFAKTLSKNVIKEITVILEKWNLASDLFKFFNPNSQ